MKRELPMDRLREVLRYDADNGGFVHALTRHSVRAGERAGTKRPDGYWVNQVDGRVHQTGRLVWFWHHGAWPTHEIDHVDGDPGNNRIENLRDVTSLVNKQNLHKAPSSKLYSPLLGAQWCKHAGKWKASIRVSGRVRHLGFFPSDVAASVAYIDAKRRLHEGFTL